MAKGYKLSVPALLSPFWMNSVKGRRHETVVQPDGTVKLENETLTFREEAITPGTRIYVTTYDWFIAYTAEEVEAEQRELDRAAAAAKEAERVKLNEIRRKAEEFNATIKLPVKWDVGIKDVLSGLSENSMGNGRNRGTVEHILLQEGLSVGKLKRIPGQFLCSSNPKLDGKRWSGQTIERWMDGDNHEYQPQVTCKKCIEIAARLSK